MMCKNPLMAGVLALTVFINNTSTAQQPLNATRPAAPPEISDQVIAKLVEKLDQLNKEYHHSPEQNRICLALAKVGPRAAKAVPSIHAYLAVQTSQIRGGMWSLVPVGEAAAAAMEALIAIGRVSVFLVGRAHVHYLVFRAQNRFRCLGSLR